MTSPWSCGTSTDRSRSTENGFHPPQTSWAAPRWASSPGWCSACQWSGASLGAMVGGAGTALSVTSAGISHDFVTEVQGSMKPGTSALFVLDAEGDMKVILHAIHGLGGPGLKKNVDVDRARLIQSALAAAPSG